MKGVEKLPSGSLLFTGEGITYFRLCAMRSALSRSCRARVAWCSARRQNAVDVAVAATSDTTAAAAITIAVRWRRNAFRIQ